MHISLAAETLFTLWGFPVTNSFLTAVLLSVSLMLFAIIMSRKVGQLESGVYNALEAIVEGFEKLVGSVITNAALAKRVLPLAGTIFLFVILSNWIGIMPFVGSVGFTHEAAVEETHAAPVVEEAAHEEAVAPTNQEPTTKNHVTFAPLFRAAYSDLNMTLALAIVAMVMVQYFGFSVLGIGYLSKFLTLKSPILTGVGLLEIVSEIVKVFSFAFRLFGNIFAGEVLLTVIATLVPYVGPVPFLGIEAFAGSIQALIFTMLTLVFISGATTSHEHEEHEDPAHAPAAAH